MTKNRITFTEAREMQENLRLLLDNSKLNHEIKTIGGADLSFQRFGTTFYAGIVVLSYPRMKTVGVSLVKMEVHFPYVPGYLAFREVPPLMEAWNQLPQKPDVLMLDGHGISHPRRMGVAAHFGVVAGHATLGCAKKKLYGTFREPQMKKHSSSKLSDPKNGEQIGFVLRSKANCAPVFISPGQFMDLSTALQIAKKCTGSYRIPEPTRIAHEMVNRFRKGEMPEGYSDLQ